MSQMKKRGIGYWPYNQIKNTTTAGRLGSILIGGAWVFGGLFIVRLLTFTRPVFGEVPTAMLLASSSVYASSDWGVCGACRSDFLFAKIVRLGFKNESQQETPDCPGSSA